MALVSAYNREGLVDFVRILVECGYEITSTGGTATELRGAGIEVVEVSELTGAEEILDGRVKTLHPKVHGGLLARRSIETHVDELRRHEIRAIDLVVNNLYPFVETIRQADASMDDALENIDIGGPAMTRAAAKNHPDVIVIVDPGDYPRIGEMLRSGDVPMAERRRLATKAFHHVATYDAAIAMYLSDEPQAVEDDADEKVITDEISFDYHLVKRPRYGENPHQSAGVYASRGDDGGVVNAEQLHGIEMSYLNYFDADAAWSVVRSFAGLGDHAAVVVKHANPCGLAVRDSQPDAWIAARDGDPISAFGGIVAFSQLVVAETADAMKGLLLDVIVAPDYTDEALEILRRRRRTRVLRVNPHTTRRLEVRTVSGGALVQESDEIDVEEHRDWKSVTSRPPSRDELADLRFAWRACRFVRSNAIVFARSRTLVGMGAGQPNRVTSVLLAARSAREKAEGAAMASDAFFPFPDGIEEAANSGITAVAQPGGSLNDEAVIDKADELGISMVFTGTRHFFH